MRGLEQNLQTEEHNTRFLDIVAVALCGSRKPTITIEVDSMGRYTKIIATQLTNEPQATFKRHITRKFNALNLFRGILGITKIHIEFVNLEKILGNKQPEKTKARIT